MARNKLYILNIPISNMGSHEKYMQWSLVISVLPLLFIFTFSRPEVEPAAGGIKSPIWKNLKCYCPNFKMYLSKFQNVFVQIVKYICGIVAATFPSLELALRGVSSRPSADWAPGVTFSNAPQISRFPRARISSNSRNGFTEYLQFICPLIGLPRPMPRPVSCFDGFDVKEVWMNQLIYYFYLLLSHHSHCHFLKFY